MKNINLKGLALCALFASVSLLLLGAAATTKYVGTFVGHGGSLTNAAGLTMNALKTSVTNVAAGATVGALDGSSITNLQASKIAAGGTLPVLNGGNLTNVTSTAVSTNADVATWVTGNGSALTNQVGAQAYLTVNGASDGVTVAVRGFSGQTYSILAVQTSAADDLFSIGKQGAVFLATNAVANWPTGATTFGGAAFVNSNSAVFLLTSGQNSKTWAATNYIAGPR